MPSTIWAIAVVTMNSAKAPRPSGPSARATSTPDANASAPSSAYVSMTTFTCPRNEPRGASIWRSGSASRGLYRDTEGRRGYGAALGQV